MTVFWIHVRMYVPWQIEKMNDYSVNIYCDLQVEFYKFTPKDFWVYTLYSITQKWL
jgi:hypothetical protein